MDSGDKLNVNTMQSGSRTRQRVILMGILLLAFNVGAWLWAVAALRAYPPLLGVAMMIYGLGARHAVDADHIAAIDNVTRKMMQARQRPVAIGLFFALGHSAIIVIVATAVALAATMLSRFEAFRSFGGLISTAASALFLLALGIMNVVIFTSIYRSYRRVRAGQAYADEDVEILLSKRGLLSRLLRPLLGMVSRSWHMLFVGALFGLGFDTATEVTMFGISASQASHGVPVNLILCFPALFAAGMCLVDSADGVLMLSAYEWAFVNPLRKLYYNMIITGVSVLVALLIGGIEALGLIGSQFNPGGGFWSAVAAANEMLKGLGFAIVGVFIVAWLASYTFYKLRRVEVRESLAAAADSGRINLSVAVTVSQLSTQNNVNFTANGTTSTFVIPSLTERSASSVVELGDGQTMGIAGLINDNMQGAVQKLPGLGDVPVLGQLFASQQFQSGQTELVMFVTPHLATPSNASTQRLPTDSYVPPGDVDFYLMGKLSGQSSGTAAQPAAVTLHEEMPKAAFGHDVSANAQGVNQ